MIAMQANTSKQKPKCSYGATKRKREGRETDSDSQNKRIPEMILSLKQMLWWGVEFQQVEIVNLKLWKDYPV